MNPNPSKPGTPLARPRIEDWLHLARRAAKRVYRRVPRTIQFDDLYQDGMLGLIEAVDAYVPGGDRSFPRYAGGIVRGRILDGLRRDAHYSRVVGSRRRRADREAEALRQQLHRPPTEAELLDRLSRCDDGTAGPAHRVVADGAHVRGVVSIEAPSVRFSQGDGGHYVNGRRVEGLLTIAAPAPESAAAAAELFEQMTRDLTREDRLIVRLYFVCNLKMNEVARAIGVGQSTIYNRLCGFDHPDTGYHPGILNALRDRPDLRRLAGISGDDFPRPCAYDVRHLVHGSEDRRFNHRTQNTAARREGAGGTARQGRRRTDAERGARAGQAPPRAPRPGRAIAPQLSVTTNDDPTPIGAPTTAREGGAGERSRLSA